MKRDIFYSLAPIFISLLLGITLMCFLFIDNKSECEFDYHLNYSTEGEGIIIYAKDGKRRIGTLDYTDIGILDSLLTDDNFSSKTRVISKLTP